MKQYRLLIYDIISGCLFLLVLIFFTMPVRAQSNCQLANSPGGCPILVQATILQGCQVSGSSSNLGNLNFGNHASLSNKNIKTSLSLDALILNCTPNIYFTMTINGGLYYSDQRYMQNLSGDKIPYQLYTDNGLTNAIGVNQPISIAVPENGNNILLPIYSAIKLTGNHASGVYSDTLIINISW